MVSWSNLEKLCSCSRTWTVSALACGNKWIQVGTYRTQGASKNKAWCLIETLYRENVSFRDRDLKRQIPCHTASKNLDAQLLRNDTSFLSNLYTSVLGSSNSNPVSYWVT